MGDGSSSDNLDIENECNTELFFQRMYSLGA